MSRVVEILVLGMAFGFFGYKIHEYSVEMAELEQSLQECTLILRDISDLLSGEVSECREGVEDLSMESEGILESLQGL